MTLQPSKRPAAFTLIEVVIGSALMALILASAYLCLQAGLSSQKMIQPRADIIQNARVALSLLTADLRDACPLSKDDPFLGMPRKLGNMEADNLDFATHNYTPRHPHEGDFCEVSYYMDKNPETGQFSLWRRRNPVMALDPLSGGSREEIATGLVGVRFEYFDGLDWYDSWGNTEAPSRQTNSASDLAAQNSLPEAVRITLLFNSAPDSKSADHPDEKLNAPAFVFQTVARLVLADRTQGSASTRNAGSGTSSTTEQPTPGT